jgi:uncharacterized protein YjbJ (UPF0337 family)
MEGKLFGNACGDGQRILAGTRKSSERKQSMKQSTKDKAKGEFHELKGKVKEKIGRATNNPNLEAEGQGEKIGGKVQKKIGRVEKVLGN